MTSSRVDERVRRGWGPQNALVVMVQTVYMGIRAASQSRATCNIPPRNALVYAAARPFLRAVTTPAKYCNKHQSSSTRKGKSHLALELGSSEVLSLGLERSVPTGNGRAAVGRRTVHDLDVAHFLGLVPGRNKDHALVDIVGEGGEDGGLRGWRELDHRQSQQARKATHIGPGICAEHSPHDLHARSKQH